MSEKKFKSLPVANAEKIDKLEKEIEEMKTNSIMQKIETLMVKIEDNGIRIEAVKKMVEEDREKLESLNFEIL
jgi:archaellum component FlaC